MNDTDFLHATTQDDFQLRELLQETIESCLNTLRRWQAPPNWSRHDWLEECTQMGWRAGGNAVREFDPTRGVPLACFLRQRIHAWVLNRYRKEWKYGLRMLPTLSITPPCDEDGAIESDLPAPTAVEHQPASVAVREAVAALPERQRRVIDRLFWGGDSEKEIACQLNIGRRMVNKLKQGALRALRMCL